MVTDKGNSENEVAMVTEIVYSCNGVVTVL